MTPEERKRRSDDLTAAALLHICWRIRSVTNGDSPWPEPPEADR